MHLLKILAAGCLLFAGTKVYSQNDEAQNVGNTVNSTANEQQPLLSADGKTLYFTRQHHPGNTGGQKDAGDIWFSELQADSSWSVAKNLGKPVNNGQANHLIGFADQGNTMYLDGHYKKDGSKATTQGLSVSRKSGSGWSFPEPVDIPYYYTKSEHISGAVHASGNILMVTLQSYDTRGAEDLYALFKRSDGSWTEPKNLGSTINTPYQEMTPFLAPDGKTLYFASNGYEGFGSRDIFMSVRLDDSWKKWSKPQNLGASVNTEGTELFYMIPEAGNFAYLSSTQNSDGMGDIMKARIKEDAEEEQQADTFDVIAVEEPAATEEAPQPEVETEKPAPATVTIRGTVRNKNNNTPIEASMMVTSLAGDSTTMQQEVKTNADGSFEIAIEQGRNYALVVDADGFIKDRGKILLSGNDNSADITRQILLTPIEVGATVKLESVLFDRGTADMLPGSEENLNEVVEFMKDNPNVTIEVSGHTDNQGRADLNLLLSKDRAASVKKYLVSNGIDTARVEDKGYGGTKPIASNAIEEERMKNRRVEFTILKK